MRVQLAVLVATLCVACGGRSAPPISPSGVVLRDTTAWNDAIMSGLAAVLVLDGTVIDTVELWFGAHVVGGDGLLFDPVRTGGEFDGEVTSGPTGHVVWRQDRARVRIADRAPYFNSCFSNPGVDGDSLVYWGLRPTPEFMTVLYAGRYVIGPGRVDTVRLEAAGLETDNCGHLPRPERVGDVYRFGEYWVSAATWQVVE